MKPKPLRRALLAAASPAAVLAAASNPALATTFDAIPNERWQPLEAAVEVPAEWKARPGRSAVKTNKFLLYTDTYGPNYRYTSTLPPLRNADVPEAPSLAESVQLRQSALLGTDSITDLGPPSAMEPAKAFDIGVEDIQLSEVKATQRVDGSNQSYYEWELQTPSPLDHHVLVSATVSGGGLYVFSVDADPAEWADHKDVLTKIQSSFAVTPAEEGRNDQSDRIYNRASTGGFR